MKLSVSPGTFSDMMKAVYEATIKGGDPGIAAWKATGLPFPPYSPYPIKVVVQDWPYEAASLDTREEED